MSGGQAVPAIVKSAPELVLHDPLAGRALEILDDRDGGGCGREAEAQPGREGGGDADHSAFSTAGWEATICSTSHRARRRRAPLHGPGLRAEPGQPCRPHHRAGGDACVPAPWPGRRVLEPLGLLGGALLKAAEGRAPARRSSSTARNSRPTRRSVGSPPPSHWRGCCTTPL